MTTIRNLTPCPRCQQEMLAATSRDLANTYRALYPTARVAWHLPLDAARAPQTPAERVLWNADASGGYIRVCHCCAHALALAPDQPLPYGPSAAVRQARAQQQQQQAKAAEARRRPEYVPPSPTLAPPEDGDAAPDVPVVKRPAGKRSKSPGDVRADKTARARVLKADGLTYGQIEGRLGVAASTLQRWVTGRP